MHTRRQFRYGWGVSAPLQTVAPVGFAESPSFGSPSIVLKVSAPHGKNLLSSNQSSVETNLTGFASYFHGAVELARDTSFKYEGAASLRFNSATVVNDNVTHNHGILHGYGSFAGPLQAMIPAGRQSVGSLWLWMPVGVSYRLATRQVKQSDRTYLESGPPKTLTGTGQWERLSTLAFTPTQNVYPSIEVIVAYDVNVQFWADGFQIEYGSAPTQFAYGGGGLSEHAPDFGTPEVLQQVEATGYVETEGFGSPEITNVSPLQTVSMTGYAETEGFGQPTITNALSLQTVSMTGFAEIEGYGSPAVLLRTEPTGYAETEAFGSVAVRQVVQPQGFAGVSSFGAISAAQIVQPIGVVPSSAFGSPSIVLKVASTGYAEAEAYGSAAVRLGVSPTGYSETETFGSPSISLKVAKTGYAEVEGFGSSTIKQTVALTGVLPSASYGSIAVAQSVQLQGVVSSPAFGIPSVSQGIQPSGVPASPAFGAASIAQNVRPNGVPAAPAFGIPAIVQRVQPAGVSATPAFGAMSITSGAQIVQLLGVSANPAFGAASIRQTVQLQGLASSPAFGAVGVLQTVQPNGHLSSGVVGVPSIALVASLQGIALDDQGFGLDVTVRLGVSPVGVPPSRGLGEPDIYQGPPRILVSPLGIEPARMWGTQDVLLRLVPMGLQGHVEGFGLLKPVIGIGPAGLDKARVFGSPEIDNPFSALVVAPAGFGGNAHGFGRYEIYLVAPPSDPALIRGGAYSIPFSRPEGRINVQSRTSGKVLVLTRTTGGVKRA